MPRGNPRKANTAYGPWYEMRRRCSANPRPQDVKYYSGRGIRVCERWQSFDNFFADMGPRPSRVHSIDRIDGNGDYEPENCRWATPLEQATNRGKLAGTGVTVGGVTYRTIKDACAALGVSRDTVAHRMWRKGMSPEDALTRPVDYHGARSHS